MSSIETNILLSHLSHMSIAIKYILYTDVYKPSDGSKYDKISRQKPSCPFKFRKTDGWLVKIAAWLYTQRLFFRQNFFGFLLHILMLQLYICLLRRNIQIRRIRALCRYLHVAKQWSARPWHWASTQFCGLFYKHWLEHNTCLLSGDILQEKYAFPEITNLEKAFCTLLCRIFYASKQVPL